MHKKLILGGILFALACAYFVFPRVQNLSSQLFGSSANIEEVRSRVGPRLSGLLVENDFRLGAQMYIRIFKEEHQLEVWLQQENAFKLFKSYQICNYSGALGPKLKEGDRQSPEGFYYVGKSALNPNSNYHLSFNLGFPNTYDQAHSRTGSFLMVHGNCVSIGCYAMTDENIEEIYLIVEAALEAGQSNVPVHAFPFRMTDERLSVERESQWFSYWENLKAGYDLFEQESVLPSVSVFDGKYVFERG